MILLEKFECCGISCGLLIDVLFLRSGTATVFALPIYVHDTLPKIAPLFSYAVESPGS